jgi:hypothetical protein
VVNIHVQEPLSGNHLCLETPSKWQLFVSAISTGEKSLIFTIPFLSTLKWIVRMTNISEEKQEKLEKSADRNTCCGFAVSFFLLFLPFPIFLITFNGV